MCFGVICLRRGKQQTKKYITWYLLSALNLTAGNVLPSTSAYKLIPFTPLLHFNTNCMVKATFVRTVASSVTYDEATISGFWQVSAKAMEIILVSAHKKIILFILKILILSNNYDNCCSLRALVGKCACQRAPTMRQYVQPAANRSKLTCHVDEIGVLVFIKVPQIKYPLNSFWLVL